MAEVSWFICCGELTVKPNNLCDARDLVVEIKTTQLPALVSISLDIAALFRTEEPGTEPPLDIRIAVLGSDGDIYPSDATWRIRFDGMQVQWATRIEQIYLPAPGFNSITIQALEDGEWKQKSAYTFLVVTD